MCLDFPLNFSPTLLEIFDFFCDIRNSPAMVNYPIRGATRHELVRARERTRESFQRGAAGDYGLDQMSSGGGLHEVADLLRFV